MENKASVLWLMQRYEEAATAARHALEVMPDSEICLRRLVEYETLAGNPRRAEHYRPFLCRPVTKNHGSRIIVRVQILGEELGMERIALADAERDFSGLVQRVCSEGVTIEVQRGDRVIARISPVEDRPVLQVNDLNDFLQRLPRLEDDAEAFAEDLRAIRRGLPKETDPWE
jgi:antitoxin (DNA-binding transcriptional repressor) of toxin-antitoxin stability system